MSLADFGTTPTPATVGTKVPKISNLECPLSGCGSSHEVRIAKDRARTPFVRCDNYGGSTIFLRGPIGSQILEANGGRVIENPIESDPGPLPTKPHPNFRPRNPSSSTDPGPARCGSCGTVIRFGQTPCPRCQTPLTWEDEDVDPDLGI